jgi:hypothetical protein
MMGSWRPVLVGGAGPAATAQLELGGEKGGESGACLRTSSTEPCR